MAKEETPVQERSREKLAKDIDKIYRNTYKKVLMLIETRTGALRGDDVSPQNKAFRGHLLTTLNNGMREIEEELEEHYLIDYVSNSEHVLKFSR